MSYDEHKIAENEHFITLVQIIRDETDEVSGIIRGLLNLVPQQRRTVIIELIKNMEAAGEDKTMIEAVSALYDDRIVAKIKEVIKG